MKLESHTINSNCKQIDSKIKEGLKKALSEATAALSAYEEACDTCRMFDDALVREYVGTVYMYNDYGLLKKGTELYCPKCSRYVWNSEWSD